MIYTEAPRFNRFFISDMMARTCCSRACAIFRTKWLLGEGPEDPEDGEASGNSSWASRTLREPGVEVEVEGWTLFSDVVVSVSEEAWDGESWGEPPSAIPARLQWAATRSTCMSRTLSSCVVVSIFVPTSISLASSFPICTARSVSMFSRIAFRFRSVVFYVTLRDKKRRISVESIFQKKPTF